MNMVIFRTSSQFTWLILEVTGKKLTQTICVKFVEDYTGMKLLLLSMFPKVPKFQLKPWWSMIKYDKSWFIMAYLIIIFILQITIIRIYIYTYICIVCMCTYIYTMIFSHWNCQATSCTAALIMCREPRMRSTRWNPRNRKCKRSWRHRWSDGKAPYMPLTVDTWDMLWYVLWSHIISDDILSPEILWYVWMSIYSMISYLMIFYLLRYLFYLW